MNRPVAACLAALLAVVVLGCSRWGGAGTAVGTASPSNGASSSGSAAPSGGLSLAEVARLESPTGMAVRKGDAAIYFLEQAGRVRRFQNGRMDSQPALDITRVVKSGGEQGLLGIAFSPDGAYMYLDYTDSNGDTRVVEYTMRGDSVDSSSRRQVLFVKQPFANHNGGQLAFGPDGDLYIGLGDGGSEGDPQDNGQSLKTLLGKILRVSPRPSGGKAYGIPQGNPFAGRSDAMPEIWAYGCAIPGASPSTPRPATSGSATSARTTGKRSTTRLRAAREGRTTAGTAWRPPTPTMGRLRPTRCQQGADDCRVDAAQGGMEGDLLSQVVPERQRSDNQEERGCEHRHKGETGARYTTDRPAHDGAQMGREGEEGARHGPCGAIAGEELLVGDPAGRHYLCLEQRQHHVAAAEHERSDHEEAVED